MIFLKLKQSGKVKGRGYVDGKPHRKNMNKEQASSRTSSIESTIITWGRHVAVTEIPGAFLQASQEESSFLRTEGTMAEILIKTNPELYRT